MLTLTVTSPGRPCAHDSFVHSSTTQAQQRPHAPEGSPKSSPRQRTRASPSSRRWHPELCSSGLDLHHGSYTLGAQRCQRLFHSLSKVLFIFRSHYLFAIGLGAIFSLRRSTPPD